MSGLQRVRDLLEAHGSLPLQRQRAALVNVWRPIRGPVQDRPLAICTSSSVSQADLVDTDIEHFSEENIYTPRHRGQIYSVKYNPKHCWFYVADMGPDEMLLFKCYDSDVKAATRFVPHTGFVNPDCPAKFTPRESIEVRSLVIYPPGM